jgi:hypothetical protein
LTLSFGEVGVKELDEVSFLLSGVYDERQPGKEKGSVWEFVDVSYCFSTI